MAEGAVFPLKQIDQTGLDFMVREIGGEPVAPEGVQSYLENSGVPLIAEDRNLLRLLMMIGCGTADALNVDEDEALPAFFAGGYLYASALAHLSPLTEVPLHGAVYDDITDTDNHDFIRVAYRSIFNEQELMVDLIEKVRSALELDSAELGQVAIIGAGSLHVVTTESLKAVRDGRLSKLAERYAAEKFLAAHPELADLDEKFRALDEN